MISKPSTMLVSFQVHPNLGPGSSEVQASGLGDIKLETPATSLSGKEVPSTINGSSSKKPSRSSNARPGRPLKAKTSPRKSEKARTVSLLPNTRQKAVAAAGTGTVTAQFLTFLAADKIKWSLEEHSADEPEWTIVDPDRADIKTSDTSAPQPETSVRPRIWASVSDFKYFYARQVP
jgi:hypothetical protein